MDTTQTVRDPLARLLSSEESRRDIGRSSADRSDDRGRTGSIGAKVPELPLEVAR